jgi:integrase
VVVDYHFSRIEETRTVTKQRQKAARRSRRPRAPKLGLHATGQGRVVLSGKEHYCGVFGTPECAQRYAELVRTWEERGRRPLKEVPLAGGRVRGLLLRELFEQFESWVDGSGLFRKEGKETSHRGAIRRALSEVNVEFGHVPVVRFTKANLLRHRDSLIAKGKLTRKGVNRKIGIICKAFAWGNERDLVPDAVFGSLSVLAPLKQGQIGTAAERGRRKPATHEQIRAVLAHLQPTIAAMLEIQFLTGMRPGEVCNMRWQDIDETPVIVDGVPCWTYFLSSSKTEHHGVCASYPLAPRVQSILRRFRKPPEAFVFSPCDAMLDLGRKRRAERQTPPSKQMRERDAAPGREFRARYTTSVYRRAIERACKTAGVERFTPHPVRHTVITEVANDPALGFGAAGALANHRTAAATQVYVHPDRRHAYRAAVALDRAASSTA